MKLKESGKKDKYLDLAREFLKNLKMKVIIKQIMIGAYVTVTNVTGGLGYKRTSGDYPNHYIIGNGQITEKGPGNLRGIAVIQIHAGVGAMEGNDTKIYQQPDPKETAQFWTKIWQPKKHNEKVEWINNMTRELEGLEEVLKAEIHIELLKKTV